MKTFTERNPFEKRNRNLKNNERFVENPIGENYMKIEFGLKAKVNPKKTIKFAEKR